MNRRLIKFAANIIDFALSNDVFNLPVKPWLVICMRCHSNLMTVLLSTVKNLPYYLALFVLSLTTSNVYSRVNCLIFDMLFCYGFLYLLSKNYVRQQL